MEKKDLVYIGLGIGLIIFLKNVLVNNIFKPASENIDKGMDNTADWIVKKEMAWNEFAHNSDTLQERYDNLKYFLGF